ncbi:MAG: RNA-binding S4 domain-containing protein [Limibacillus sp.]|jgi:ribosome-associated heat shock protein Hsp15
MSEPADSQRLDKWLWSARFFKSRSLASKVCQAGQVRIDGEATAKAHFALRGGEVLTFRQGDHIRIVKVLFLAERRGPASEAQGLYEDLAPPSREAKLPLNKPSAPGSRPRGAGRPTKKDRREIARLKDEL